MTSKKRTLRHVVAVLPLTLITLIVLGAISLSSPRTQVTPHVAAPPGTGLPDEVGTALVKGAADFDVSAIEQCSDTWFVTYVASRIVNTIPGVSFDLLAPHPPVSYDPQANETYGPWTAKPDYGATDARADGSISEWADHYYITHDWSEYGQQILGMMPGDQVSINGRTMVVQGVLDYPKDSFYEEILQIAGNSSVVLQTCIPQRDYNRIVFGT
ncbi:MAG: hypothetical protein Q4A07_13735 [Coriobacteriales bacterium]|nr:hypothetical protein [Coriobacteriales bacterium]